MKTRLFILIYLTIIIIPNVCIAQINNLKNYKWVIEDKYDHLVDHTYQFYNEGTYSIDNKWLFLNQKGYYIKAKEDTVIEKTFKNYYTDPFIQRNIIFRNKGYPIVSNKYWGLVDKNLDVIIEPRFSLISIFENGLALASPFPNRLKHGYIDSLGTWVIPPIYDNEHRNPLADSSDYAESSYSISFSLLRKRFFHNRAFVQKEGKWKIIDTKGNIVKDLDIDNIDTGEYERYRIFVKNGKKGVITYDGDIVFEALYDKIGITNKDIFIVSIAEKSGLVNAHGKTILDMLYDEIEFHHSGLLFAKKDGKEGILDLNGKVALPLLYDKLMLPKDNTTTPAVAKKDGNYYLIDLISLSETKLANYDLVQGYSSGMAVVEKNGKRGYINDKGAETIPLIWDVIQTDNTYFEDNFNNSNPDFIGDYATVLKNNNWGLIDKSGKVIIEPQFYSLFPKEKGYAYAKTIENCKLFDRTGSFITQRFNCNRIDTMGDILVYNSALKWSGPDQSYADKLMDQKGHEIPIDTEIIKIHRSNYKKNDQLIPVSLISQTGNTFGFMDKQNKVIIKNKNLNDDTKFSEGYAPICDWQEKPNQKRKIECGFMDQEGNIQFLEGISRLSILKNNRAIAYFEDNSKYGMLDKTGKWVLEPKYGRIQQLGKDFYYVNQGDLKGIINNEGKLITGIEYEGVTSDSEGILGIKKGGKWGYINDRGKIIIEPKFDEIAPFHRDRAAVSIGNKWFYIDKKGKPISREFLGQLSDHTQRQCCFSEDNYTEVTDVINMINGYRQGMNQDLIPHVIYDTTEGLKPVFLVGYMNQSERVIIKPKYQDVFSFFDGVSWVRTTSYKYNLIDKKGEVIPTSDFISRISNFENGLSVISLRDSNLKETEGVIDTTGKWIIPPEYPWSSITILSTGQIVIVDRAMKGIIKIMP